MSQVLSADALRKRRRAHIALAVVVMVSFVGLFIGHRAPELGGLTPKPMPELSAGDTEGRGEVTRAKSYLALQREAMTIADDELDALLHTPLDAPSSIPSPEKKRLTLEKRASRRAFDGAPPTVPHPIVERGALPCVACHQSGFSLAAAHPGGMSHPRFAQCTQCHVSSVGPFPPDFPSVGVSISGPNLFVGLERPGPGERAWHGAPPTIPHTTWMRSRCASCHAPHRHPGLQTTHSERQSCVQCHASSATLDQHPLFTTLSSPPPLRQDRLIVAPPLESGDVDDDAIKPR